MVCACTLGDQRDVVSDVSEWACDSVITVKLEWIKQAWLTILAFLTEDTATDSRNAAT